jgi:hypothetical protein
MVRFLKFFLIGFKINRAIQNRFEILSLLPISKLSISEKMCEFLTEVKPILSIFHFIVERKKKRGIISSTAL